MNAQELGPAISFTDWKFYAYKVYSTMTDAEWVVFFLAILIGWIVVEYIKRGIVWKTKASEKGGLAIMIPLGGNAHFRLSIIHIISFLVTAGVAYVMWPIEGHVKHTYMIAGIAGTVSPVIHKLFIVLLCKIGLRGIAVWITGDRRLANKPANHDMERRE